MALEREINYRVHDREFREHDRFLESHFGRVRRGFRAARSEYARGAREARAYGRDASRGLRDADRAARVHETALGRVGRAWQRVSQFVKAYVAFALVRVFTDGSRAAFKFGTDANETANKFRAVFGQAADAADAQLSGAFEGTGESLANLTGRSQTAAREFVATVGAIHKAAGASEEDAAAFGIAWLKAAGDLQSFNDISAEVAEEKLLSFLSGEVEPIRRLGYNILQSAVNLRVYGSETRKSGQAVNVLAEQQARLDMLLEQMGASGALGDLVKTYDEVANRARTAQAVWKQNAELLAQGLLPTWALLLDQLAEGDQAFNRSRGGLAGFLSTMVFEGVVGVLKFVRAVREIVTTVLRFFGIVDGAGAMARDWQGTLQGMGDSAFAFADAVSKAAEFVRRALAGIMRAVSDMAGTVGTFLKRLGKSIVESNVLEGLDWIPGLKDRVADVRDVGMRIAGLGGQIETFGRHAGYAAERNEYLADGIARSREEAQGARQAFNAMIDVRREELQTLLEGLGALPAYAQALAAVTAEQEAAAAGTGKHTSEVGRLLGTLREMEEELRRAQAASEGEADALDQLFEAQRALSEIETPGGALTEEARKVAALGEEAARVVERRRQALHEEIRLMQERVRLENSLGRALQRFEREAARSVLRGSAGAGGKFGVEGARAREAGIAGVIQDTAAAALKGLPKDAEALRPLLERLRDVRALTEADRQALVALIAPIPGERDAFAGVRAALAQWLEDLGEARARVDDAVEKASEVQKVAPYQASMDELEKALSLFERQMEAIRAGREAGRLTDGQAAEAAAEAQRTLETAVQGVVASFGDLDDVAPPVLALITEALRLAGAEGREFATDTERLADTFGRIANALRAIGRFADVFGGLSDDARDLVGNLADAAASMYDLLETRQRLQDRGTGLGSFGGVLAQLPGFLGVAGGVLGAVGALGDIIGGPSAQERAAQARVLAENTRAVQRNTEALLGADIVGGGSTRAQVDAAAAAVARLRPFLAQDDDMLEHLFDFTDLASTVEEAFADIIDAFPEASEFRDRMDALIESGVEPAEAFRQVMGELIPVIEGAIDAFGEYGDSLSAALRFFRDVQTYGGLSEGEAFDAFLGRLEGMNLGGDVAALLAQVRGLDLTTADGQEQLRALIAAAFAAIQAGDFDFGGLTPEEVQRLFDSLLSVGEGAGGQETRGTTVARTITEVQANEVVALLYEGLLAARSLLTEAKTHTALLSDIASALGAAPRPDPGRVGASFSHQPYTQGTPPPASPTFHFTVYTQPSYRALAAEFERQARRANIFPS